MTNETFSASARTWRRVLLTVAAFAATALWTLAPARSQTPTGDKQPTGVIVFDSTPSMPAGNKQISGIVVNEKKQPVAGILVGLSWRWSSNQANGMVMSGVSSAAKANTDAEGRFVFPNLPAGQFRYEIYSPKSEYVTQAAPLIIAERDIQKTLHIVVSRGALVTGKVVDGKTGKPLADVVVGAGPIPPGGNMAKWGEWPMPSLVPTDAQGHYQIRVAPGTVFVGVGRTVGGTASSQRVLEAARRVAAPAGKTVAAPNLPVLLRPMLLCVGPDGKPITNAAILFIPENVAQAGYITHSETDNTGAVTLGRNIDAPRPDSGSFRMIQDELAASGTYHWSPYGPLVVVVNGQESSYPDGVGTVKLLPDSTSPVTGTVVSADGRPIPDAQVRIFEIDPRSHEGLGDKSVKTNAAGAFRIPLNPNGEYHAYVRADGFNQVSVSDKPLPVIAGKPTDLGAIRLLRADGFILGTVVDTAGKPMAGVLTNVQDGKTGISAAVTDAEGKFRIPNIVPGERLTLHVCLHGEAPDSGQALSQSNEEMNIPDAYASSTPIKIVWRPK